MLAAAQPCVLITGMSGTGKSTVLEELRQRGFMVHDMDEPSRSYMDELGHQRWNLPDVASAIEANRTVPFFICGCSEDQAAIRALFTHVVLLSVPRELLLKRIAERTTNTFGKSAEELAVILADLEQVEPLLRKNATAEIDTSEAVGGVVSRILSACGLT